MLGPEVYLKLVHERGETASSTKPSWCASSATSGRERLEPRHGHIEWQDGVALVRLGAEQNMVNGDFVDGINRALDEVEANPDAKALVTAGEGKFYSYGFDLEYIQSLGADGDAFLTAAGRSWPA